MAKTYVPLSALEEVTSGRISRGHRFLGSQQITINEPAEYFAVMKQNSVIVDQNEREKMFAVTVTNRNKFRCQMMPFQHRKIPLMFFHWRNDQSSA